jgi:hypothetical protein
MWLLVVLAPAAVVGAGLPSSLREPGPLARRIANYTLSAELDPKSHRIHGKEHLSWLNTTTQPADRLPFHLYMNAFKNDKSAFLREGRAGEGRQVSSPSHYGWIDVSSLKARGVELRPKVTIARCAEDEPETRDCPQDETVMDVPLAEPIAPGQTAELDLVFEVQLPEVVERTGYADTFYMVGQWFPKIGVYENAPGGGARWNCHAFHANSEFYADFGEYVVTITVPKDYVVGASGVRAREEPVEGGKARYVYHAEDVHDFAWTADPSFRAAHERSGDVDITVLYHAGSEHALERELRATRAGLAELSRIAFPYPYRTLTVVEPTIAAFNAGGMEYPTLITTAPGVLAPPGLLEFEEVTAHEFGHQYWYGMLASNEFEEAWLDEGVNTYATGVVMDDTYGPLQSFLSLWGLVAGYWVPNRLGYVGAAKWDPLETYSWRFSPGHYSTVYSKTGVVLKTLEGYLGRERMLAGLGAYARKHRFTHPHAEDFFHAFATATGEDLQWFFRPAFFGTDVVDYEVSELESEPSEPELGFFDQADGKRVEVKPGKSPSPQEAYETDVVVHRIGDFRFPVELRISYEDGRDEFIHWDGAARWQRFQRKGPQRARWATVDAAHRVLLDANWLNDGLRREQAQQPTRRMRFGLTFLLQSLMQAVGLG